MSRAEMCARCEHFTTKDESGATLPQAAHGIGRCKGFDGHVAPVEPYVRFNATPCVLFGRAKDIAMRQPWIDKQIAKAAQ